MKFRNKQTGEIDDFLFEVITNRIDLYRRVGSSDTKNIWRYKSLAELNKEWEDYEEPKTFYNILPNGGVQEKEITTDGLREEFIKDAKEIGNYFLSREEAEKAVEKLKAWKRLKDKGLRITDWNCPCRELEFAVDEVKFFKASGEVSEETRADLDLLFSGEGEYEA